MLRCACLTVCVLSSGAPVFFLFQFSPKRLQKRDFSFSFFRFSISFSPPHSIPLLRCPKPHRPFRRVVRTRRTSRLLLLPFTKRSNRCYNTCRNCKRKSNNFQNAKSYTELLKHFRSTQTLSTSFPWSIYLAVTALARTDHWFFCNKCWYKTQQRKATYQNENVHTARCVYRYLTLTPSACSPRSKYLAVKKVTLSNR